MVTISMIEEHLSGCSLAYLPARRSTSFKHLMPLSAQGTPLANSPLAPGALFIGALDEAIACAQNAPDAWIFCIYGPQSTFDASTLSLDHAILCCTPDDPEQVQQRLTELFCTIADWVMDMKSALLQGGSYQSLLDRSERILKNFIAISDSEFRLMAYTQHVDIDDPHAQTLVERGCHPQETVERFKRHNAMRTWETQTRIETKPAEITKHPVMDYIFRTHGSYFLHVVMQCNHVPATPALRDAFQLLIDHIEHCVRQDKSTAFPLDNEPSRLFDDLASRRPIPKGELERRLAASGIPRSSSFQLLVMAFPGNAEESQYLSYYAARAKRAFTACHIGIHSTYVLVLDPASTLLSQRTSQLQAFVNMHPCVVGASETFTDMDGFAFAFQQARSAAALALRDPRTLAQQLQGSPAIPIHRFADAFAAFVADVALTGNRLIGHSARNGIVARIRKFDEEHGTFDAKMLFWYLQHERNVRRTCEELFVHRSTLLYRIRTMQERFGFDLEDADTRERIKMEYLVLPAD